MTFRRSSHASAKDPNFAAMIVDAFDVMQHESKKRPLVMGIALHAYIVGWPHRFKHLAYALKHIVDRAEPSVWFTTAGNIAAHAETTSVRNGPLR